MNTQEYCEAYLEKYPQNPKMLSFGVVNVYGVPDSTKRYYGNIHRSSGTAAAMTADIPPLYRIRIKSRG